METFAVLMEKLNNFVWGPPMMILLLGVGLFLTVGLRFISLTKIGYGFNQLFKKRLCALANLLPKWVSRLINRSHHLI